MKSLPIFFSPRMVAPSQAFSPSSEKPAAVVSAWRALGIPLTVLEPAPVTVEQLSLVHDASYVRAVLEGKATNGFGNRSSAVAASLPYTSGAMLSAARHAWRSGTVAVAPCSGFHHAQWDHASGFCTFNGLMVTASVLHAEGAHRVGIFDADQHFGDGTEALIKRLRADWVHHVTVGKTWTEPGDADAFFASLGELLRGFAGCDVVLYQAGADPHINDPLGGWLTTEQLRARDRAVFEFFAVAGIPVAWNLAGGYQRDAKGTIAPVIEIHVNTLRECFRAFGER